MRRKSYEKNFKAKVALEALREECTLQELGKRYASESTGTVEKAITRRIHRTLFETEQESVKEREYEEREEALLKRWGR